MSVDQESRSSAMPAAATTVQQLPVTVTVFQVGGGALLLGPVDFQTESVVRDVRSQLLAKQQELQHEFPWQPKRRVEVQLLLGDQLLKDDEDNPQFSGNIELTAVLHEVEVKREGLTLEDVIRVIEEGKGGMSDWRGGSKCLGLYVHGSWAYSYKAADDVDLLAVVEEPPQKCRIRQGGSACELELRTCFGAVQVIILTREQFTAKLEAMDLTALTCLSLPPCFVLREFEDERARNLALDIPLLKESIIAFADAKYLSAVLHGFGDKAGCKLVYYAFRAIEMGIQLLTHGQIVEFRAGKEWYEKACSACEEAIDDAPQKSYYQDFVQAMFARDFEQQIQRFLQCCDGGVTAAAVVENSRPAADDTCKLCQQPLGEKGGAKSDMWCQLVNCGHYFHSKCMAVSVQTQHLQVKRYWKNQDLCAWDISHPIAKCPTCDTSVRLELSAHRAKNLRRVLHDQPLERAGAALHLLYKSTINFHCLLRYSSWDTAVERSQVPDGERFAFEE
eukprot:TRINITY_DN41997_c0_g1_i1.p1 TRINITY_DN41997_c0_g1~~TRINITY_DN41997_c0_g1_i1.p1  ORF type:complete len:504 (-),score=105.85 TRINITY_DN41997_c0_g1_i1:6-1517(-)